jgi:PPK2 family polyphosphate:nucleotide phosphotransferase
MARSPGSPRPLREALRVRPGSRVGLAGIDPSATFGHTKESAAAELKDGLDRLTDLQDRIWAEGKHKVLVVLQGIDAAGKDGTLRHVMGAFNPQGCPVTAFKEPSPDDLAHDYLWRVHRRVPATGEIGVFNRSHYEDIVTASILGVVDGRRRKHRIRHVREFERMLTDEGTTVRKVFLHISRDEQRKRLQARLADPTKRWKFRKDDLATRARWDEYVHCYDEAIGATSTQWAPWYVVPADHKWASALAVAELLVATLEAMDPQIPPPAEDLDGVVVE